METGAIKERLEYLRGELRAERISLGELHELQGLAAYIESGDVELLEAAGVPEFEEEDEHAATTIEEQLALAHDILARFENIEKYNVDDPDDDEELAWRDEQDRSEFFEELARTGGRLAELVLRQHRPRPARQSLYIDATIAVSEPGLSSRTQSFGPFASRRQAEKALTSFIGRENAMGAVIRDPDA